MTVTLTPPPAGPSEAGRTEVAVGVEPMMRRILVSGWGSSPLTLLESVQAALERQRAAEAEQILLVAQLADAYATLPSVDLDAPEPQRLFGEQLLQSSYDGTPPVAESLGHELGPALRISPDSAWALIWDTLALRERHPVLWDLMMAGRVQVWRARKVVQACRRLSLETARGLDSELSARLPVWGPCKTANEVDRALLRLDPGLEASRQAARAARRVEIERRQGTPGISEVFALLDSDEAAHLDGTLNQLPTPCAGAGPPSHAPNCAPRHWDTWLIPTGCSPARGGPVHRRRRRHRGRRHRGRTHRRTAACRAPFGTVPPRSRDRPAPGCA